MTKIKILKVPLEDKKLEGYITHVDDVLPQSYRGDLAAVAPGGGLQRPLSGFVILRNNTYQYNHVSTNQERTTLVNKTTTFWDESGTSLTQRPGCDIIRELNLFTVRHLLAPEPPTKTYIKTRIKHLLADPQIQLIELDASPSLYAPEAIPVDIDPKLINGRPATFPLVPGVPQPLHVANGYLITSVFLTRTNKEKKTA